MWTNPRAPRYLVGTILLAAAACGGRTHPSSAPGAPGAARDSVDVGYGAQRKDKTTGAVTGLSDRELNTRPLRIEQLLRGRVAGLQVVQGPTGTSFRIRQTGSVLIDQEPLFIVDGVQIPEGGVASALAGLLPDDIKSVSVLKDVASTSIYGGRGAGGVILIATKK